VGISACRGLRATKLPPPLVRTPICSQRAGPVNMFAPKSSVTVKSPFVTGTPEPVSGPATTVAPPAES
jgi:hypothetical protein